MKEPSLLPPDYFDEPEPEIFSYEILQEISEAYNKRPITITEPEDVLLAIGDTLGEFLDGIRLGVEVDESIANIRQQMEKAHERIIERWKQDRLLKKRCRIYGCGD